MHELKLCKGVHEDVHVSHPYMHENACMHEKHYFVKFELYAVRDGACVHPSAYMHENACMHENHYFVKFEL